MNKNRIEIVIELIVTGIILNPKTLNPKPCFPGKITLSATPGICGGYLYDYSLPSGFKV